jgi:hypothetical protein
MGRARKHTAPGLACPNESRRDGILIEAAPENPLLAFNPARRCVTQEKIPMED